MPKKNPQRFGGLVQLLLLGTPEYGLRFVLPSEDRGKSNLRNVVGFLACNIVRNFGHDSVRMPLSVFSKTELTGSMWQRPTWEASVVVVPYCRHYAPPLNFISHMNQVHLRGPE
jgi:hypothetical protein